ncbi:hypothetical protein EJ07DRAFT_158971 [Lizonia empirigonia]|nr:hypothetical protein EJ07DRAFT_158971 [Lizonia empirigonia]
MAVWHGQSFVALAAFYIRPTVCLLEQTVPGCPTKHANAPLSHQIVGMAESTQTASANVQLESIRRDASEMRGVLELQAMLLSDLARRENQMEGACRTGLSAHGQDLERLKVDTAEALQKIWSNRYV